MARDLFRSLHSQLLTLPDPTRVLPAHGAGSACGKNMSSELTSTIGEQRAGNYALQTMDEDEFVHLVTEGQPARPRYFSYDAERNREAHALLDERDAPRPMSLTRVLALQAEGTQVLDTRAADDFALGHLIGSVNVGLEGRFAEYAGAVLDAQRPIVLVSDPNSELEAKLRLARIGFDDVVGALADPLIEFVSHPEHVGQAKRLSADEVADQVVLDIRGPGETEAGHLEGAQLIPLPRLVDELDKLDPTRPTVVYCAGGYRSSIAASVLRANGFTDVADVIGGYGAIQMARSRPSQ